MKKIILGIFSAITFSILTISIAFALPNNVGVNKAKEVSPAINEEGVVVAPPEFVLQLPESRLTKVVFIRYAPGKAPKCDNDGICEAGENSKNCQNDCPANDETSACYGFLSGAKPKWNWVEDYHYSTSTLALPTTLAVSIWEGATAAEIFGNGFLGSFNWGIYDYKNAVSYGNYSDPNVLAVTAIWFQGKNIYEYDIMMDTDYFPNAGTPDSNTVVLHEFGHAAGLDDLYNSACLDNVMYGYYHGEDLDLGTGDIFGIQKLYGI